MIILFTGPGGAGKSTLARAWVEAQDRPIAHIEADQITGFVRHGSEASINKPRDLDDVIEQYRVSGEVYASMAETYQANGLDVAIAHLYGRPPKDSPWYRGEARIERLNPIFVVLYPTRETCRERLLARGSDGDTGSYEFGWPDWDRDPRAIMLDNTNLTVAESVAAVDELLAQRVEQLA